MLFSEYLKVFKKPPPKAKLIGFYPNKFPLRYSSAMASTRLRILDVIKYFSNYPDYYLELIKPGRKYDCVIFQKRFNPSSYQYALKQKKHGTKIILDINVNYFNPRILDKNHKYLNRDIINFVLLCDYLISPSRYILEYAQNIFPHLPSRYIPEPIDQDIFQNRINPTIPQKKITLLFIGYAIKAKELSLIKHILKNLSQLFDITYLFICESRPTITIPGIHIAFKKFNPHTLSKDILSANLYLAPRDLHNPYNLGHSFTKIGIPMAVGIPVIASPIPSYRGSPAILLPNFKEDWVTVTKSLLTDQSKYQALSEKGIAYVKSRYHTNVVMTKYKRLFDQVLSQ